MNQCIASSPTLPSGHRFSRWTGMGPLPVVARTEVQHALPTVEVEDALDDRRQNTRRPMPAGSPACPRDSRNRRIRPNLGIRAGRPCSNQRSPRPAFDRRETSMCRNRRRKDVEDRRFLQDHSVIVCPDLDGHRLDEDLSPISQPQPRGRTRRHAPVQIRVTDDRSTQSLSDGHPQWFGRIGPRGPRCEHNAAGYARHASRFRSTAAHFNDPQAPAANSIVVATTAFVIDDSVSTSK